MGFTLDCCHGSANLPMSTRQGRSVWQRYCLRWWFTLYSIATIFVYRCLCMCACVSEFRLSEFVFVHFYQGKQVYESLTESTPQAGAPIKEDRPKIWPLKFCISYRSIGLALNTSPRGTYVWETKTSLWLKSLQVDHFQIWVGRRTSCVITNKSVRNQPDSMSDSWHSQFCA